MLQINLYILDVIVNTLGGVGGGRGDLYDYLMS